MDWKILLIVVAVFAVWLTLKRLSLVSATVAQEYLRKGALVVDVRSEDEFRSRHLPGAVNITLDDLAQSLPARVKDKQQPVLLHCLSGTRSGMARRELKRMGYANVFNLGSYSRAEQIVGKSGR